MCTCVQKVDAKALWEQDVIPTITNFSQVHHSRGRVSIIILMVSNLLKMGSLLLLLFLASELHCKRTPEPLSPTLSPVVLGEFVESE